MKAYLARYISTSGSSGGGGRATGRGGGGGGGAGVDAGVRAVEAEDTGCGVVFFAID